MKQVILNHRRFVRDNLNDEKNAGDVMLSSTSEMHYGTFFGLTSKILTAFGCVVYATLPITGFYIWWGRNRKKLVRNKSKGFNGRINQVSTTLTVPCRCPYTFEAANACKTPPVLYFGVLGSIPVVVGPSLRHSYITF